MNLGGGDGASLWMEARSESWVRLCLLKRSFLPGQAGEGWGAGTGRGSCWYVWGVPPPSPHDPRWISIMHRAPTRNPYKIDIKFPTANTLVIHCHVEGSSGREISRIYIEVLFVCTHVHMHRDTHVHMHRDIENIYMHMYITYIKYITYDFT